MKCKKCGQTIIDNSNVCPYCGTNNSSNKKTNKNIIVIALVLIIATCIFSYNYLTKDKNTNNDENNKQQDINNNQNNSNNDYKNTQYRFSVEIYNEESEIIDDIFTYEIPSVFKNKGRDTSLKYIYGDDPIFNNCAVTINTIFNFENTKKFIYEISKFYKDTNNTTKETINNIEWTIFKGRSMQGKEYYYAADIQNKVYLYKFEFNDENYTNRCQAYHEAIINSIKLK